MRIKINPQNCIPKYWCRGIYVSIDEDLASLGSTNLKSLKWYWEGEEHKLAQRIGELQADIDLLSGKTVEDIKAIATQYENPSFPQIGMISGKYRSNDLEPLDVDSNNRKGDATTFNVCGWCKHCRGSYVSYNYYITGYCPLIPRKLGNGEKRGGGDVHRFNTPCKLANGTQELLEACVHYLKTKKSEMKARKRRIRAYVRYIAKIGKGAEEKPYLPSHRPYDWFNIGDSVVCFIDLDDAVPGINNQFVTGKVIAGYRHHEGCVSIVADKKIHNNMDGHGGCRFNGGKSHPQVMHQWEYEYLKANPDFLTVWLRCAEEVYSSSFGFAKFRAAFATI